MFTYFAKITIHANSKMKNLTAVSLISFTPVSIDMVFRDKRPPPVVLFK